MKYRRTSWVMVLVMVVACTYRQRITVKPNRADGSACVDACIDNGSYEDEIYDCAAKCPGIVKAEGNCKGVPSPCADRSRTDIGATVAGVVVVVLVGGLIAGAVFVSSLGNISGMCAAEGTPIATPTGEVPIESLRRGDIVLSMHRGRLQAVPLRAVGRRAVRDHVMVELVLDNGRTVAMSPSHPTADSHTFGELAANARLGDARVVAVRRTPYHAPFTYDILPDSDTGTYVAAGALVGSTLARTRTHCGARSVTSLEQIASP